MTDVIRTDLDGLVERVEGLRAGRPRTLLGIAGPPGAGKSTVAAALNERLQNSVVVGMDGFHLAQAELERLGRADRKGAPDTFDPGGYAALLARLRANAEPVVYAPVFRRDLEEPIGSCVPVPQGVSCVVTEGNYLLMDEYGWRTVRDHLDEIWFLSVPQGARQDRLVRRRMGHGASPEEARHWTMGSDERNAEIIETTRPRADLIVELVG